MISLPLYLLIVNAITFVLYWHDKRAARSGGWRVSEFMLLLAGFLGGTLAGFAAQRALRHKNRKSSFMLKFWLVTVAQILILLFPPQLLAAFFRRFFA